IFGLIFARAVFVSGTALAAGPRQTPAASAVPLKKTGNASANINLKINKPVEPQSQQFVDRFCAGIDEVLRAALQVLNRRVRAVDTQVLIQRGEDFRERDRPLDRLTGNAVGRADDLSRSNAATSEQ